MLLTLGDTLGFHAVEDDSDGAHPRGLPCQGHAPQCDSQSKSSGALILFSYCLFLQRLDLLQMSRPVVSTSSTRIRQRGVRIAGMS